MTDFIGDKGERQVTQSEGQGAITDCGPDGGCCECEVCRYLDFLDRASQVGSMPEGMTLQVQRDKKIEAYLDKRYPHWRTI